MRCLKLHLRKEKIISEWQEKKFPCQAVLRSFPYTIESLITVVTCAGYETITKPRFHELVKDSFIQESGIS